MTTPKQRSVWIAASSLVALGFGLVTIKAGGTILFGDEAARIAAGNVVAFVLWFNFLAGFAYVIAGVGLWMQTRWAAWLAVAIVLATALTFLAFALHGMFGGAYEQRTVIAMSLRTLIWAVIASVAWRQLLQTRPGDANTAGKAPR
jgi:uncharacterized membrane protein (DUF2068 family)